MDVKFANELISIIIPVYNVGSYLEQCVNSVLSQTYKKFELILVDDGSTDDSGELCDAFSLSDSRICVFHKKNEGAAIARNYGLDRAKGKYIIFVDSDDWIAPELLEECLAALINTGSDIVMYKYNAIDEKGEICPFDGNLNKFNSSKPLTMDYALRCFFKGQLETYVWSFMAKRCLYEFNGKIRFSKEKVFEDLSLMYKLFARTRRVLVLNKKYYYYRQRTSSLIHSENGFEFSLLYSNVFMDEFNYFASSTSRYGVSVTTYDVMLLRCLEAQIAAYYGMLRKRVHGENNQLLTVRDRIYSMLEKTKERRIKLSFGMLLRIYAVKYRLDRALVEVERCFRR